LSRTRKGGTPAGIHEVGKRLGAGVGNPTARGAGGNERLVHDPPDGTGAPAALGAASQATIDVAGRSQRRCGSREGAAYVVVGEHVAGTDDHSRKARPPIGIACNYLHNAKDAAAQEEIAVFSRSNLAIDKMIR
jgi:hypothetical protein